MSGLEEGAYGGAMGSPVPENIVEAVKAAAAREEGRWPQPK
jgi:hypothetical protein